MAMFSKTTPLFNCGEATDTTARTISEFYTLRTNLKLLLGRILFHFAPQLTAVFECYCLTVVCFTAQWDARRARCYGKSSVRPSVCPTVTLRCRCHKFENNFMAN